MMSAARSLRISRTASIRGSARCQAHAGTSTATGKSPASWATPTLRAIVALRAIERSSSFGRPGIGSSATIRSPEGQFAMASASRVAARAASLRPMPGGARNTRVVTSPNGAAIMQRRSVVFISSNKARSVSRIAASTSGPTRGTARATASVTSSPFGVIAVATIEISSGPRSTPSGRRAVLRKNNTFSLQ